MDKLHLEAWTEECLFLLYLQNTPEMTKYLGGPETEAQIISRHNRYLNMGDTGTFYRIIFETETIGSVGYWEHLWKGQMIYEIGWAILPDFQGKGLATPAVAKAIEKAKLENKHSYIHAFPSISNPASNAICRKLHFTLVEQCQFEYPIGHFMQTNDWKLQI
ncbi:GNAT family N-acetyltransferase [Shimazuella sp. AN120528]|uniref:GNAT family N-acetyltransferase n=1 Tax=Shimazuella soli TaxID=1892854 RepID=UPI001F0F6360|nr:GNAT family N-acetyltransferase [Shimazuella soli]MCH5585483.1 GNAT family N-acetyltransferase [Shimazuella soli]